MHHYTDEELKEIKKHIGPWFDKTVQDNARRKRVAKKILDVLVEEYPISNVDNYNLPEILAHIHLLYSQHDAALAPWFLQCTVDKLADLKIKSSLSCIARLHDYLLKHKYFRSGRPFSIDGNPYLFCIQPTVEMVKNCIYAFSINTQRLDALISFRYCGDDDIEEIFIKKYGNGMLDCSDDEVLPFEILLKNYVGKGRRVFGIGVDNYPLEELPFLNSVFTTIFHASLCVDDIEEEENNASTEA